MAIGFRRGVAELKTAVEGYQMTAQGLQRLGVATMESSGPKAPGAAVPTAVMVATGSPVGRIVSGAMKISGEVTGKGTIEGRADQTAREIAEALKNRFREFGWIA